MHQPNMVEILKESFNSHLKYSLAREKISSTKLDNYTSIALAVRNRLIEKWIQTQQTYFKKDVKQVYYLSMEYLVGRALTNYLVNIDFEDECRLAIKELGFCLEEFAEIDIEPGLGNGGLGRLASCYMESMATLGIPAKGYGIRYEFGIFQQRFKDGYQVEVADYWLNRGNPWEIPRQEHLYPIKFYGRVKHTAHPGGKETFDWVDTHDNVMAMAYDVPIPGYKNNTVNNLRLWDARSTQDFDFEYFNNGDYIEAVREKLETETISKVLYPNDKSIQGRELRLKQEYFFVSASLQDIIRRYKRLHSIFDRFSEKIAIQLNDTHPALAIPELMRILLDQEEMEWDKAWDVTVNTMAYTNHTVLPEALEKWSVELMGNVLPRHLQIIYEINRRFLKDVETKYPNDIERVASMSIIEEEPVKMVRMANLCIVGSHAVNGVAALHSKILIESLFKEFHEMFPGRFQNITNGISPRLWLKGANPELADLITKHIGADWIRDLSHLKNLLPLRDDKSFRDRWWEIKKKNKRLLAEFIAGKLGIQVNADSMFDVQIKRVHEYKRQLMNILHVVALYNRIHKDPQGNHLPRTVIFGGKAAPGYAMAKLVIKLINSVAKKINADPVMKDRLKVVYIPNYSVSLAEKIIPAADLSQQISTAGMEASGTGNMKLALNGALTVGTLDGANVEIAEEVGDDNIYIFGLKVHEIAALKEKGYSPWDYYTGNKELKQVLDMIREGFFCPENPDLFQPILNSLLDHGDHYMVLADFTAYSECQKGITKDFLNTEQWIRTSITNVALIGKFSGDRAILEYARDIWDVQPVSELAKPTK